MLRVAKAYPPHFAHRTRSRSPIPHGNRQRIIRLPRKCRTARFQASRYAVRKDESALDIVQDAMIKLAEKYGDKPAAELPMLFQRILQNTILDYFRREKSAIPGSACFPA
jgi:DNA-directed RNA polymerase specialized sigma24 family protein